MSQKKKNAIWTRTYMQHNLGKCIIGPQTQKVWKNGGNKQL